MTTAEDRENRLADELLAVWTTKPHPIRMWAADYDFMNRRKRIVDGAVLHNGHIIPVIKGPPRKKRRKKRPQESLV